MGLGPSAHDHAEELYNIKLRRVEFVPISFTPSFAKTFRTSLLHKLDSNTYATKYQLSRDKSAGLVKLAKLI